MGYRPAETPVKERGRAVSNLLYLDPALSRPCRNAPPNHKHNRPGTVLQAHTPDLPLILQHERLQQRLQVLVPLVGFEWGC